ncbi:hypothetical protein PT974_11976 [Cladobotryum mycophilum]|uniref:Uncharacterized protein n=1 Tax=Cladobotryum mycophilum TaxID=491253 RepID=A0ABR0S7N3_9HYPO
MALLRHTAAPLRSLRCARQPIAAARTFSITARRQGGHGNESQVSTWALEEARRRLEAEGVLPDPSNQKKD